MNPDDPRCPCHGKTEAELAAPYASFAFGLTLLILAALGVAAVMS